MGKNLIKLYKNKIKIWRFKSCDLNKDVLLLLQAIKPVSWYNDSSFHSSKEGIVF